MPKYDLAVIGAGLGGLAAAARLSKKNKKTIVFEPREDVGGAVTTVRENGFLFSTGPTLSFGFERGGALEELYSELGIAHSASVLSPCYQVALPDRRITVYAETGETLEELRREFPREIDFIAKFYRDLRALSERNAKSRVSAYVSARRSAEGFIRKYRFSGELKAFLDIPSLFFFQQPAAGLSLTSLVTMFDTSPLTVHGGFKKLADQLLSFILKNGGEVRYAEPWPELSQKNGRVTGLVTTTGFVEASSVLINTEQHIRHSILFIGLKDEVVPLGMSQEVLGLPDYSRREHLFTVSLSAHDNEAAAPKGMRTLTALFPSFSHAADRKDTPIELIRGLIPFLDRYQVCIKEHRPAPRQYPTPPGFLRKPATFASGQPLLDGTSIKNVYMLHDDAVSPLRAVYAARQIAERLM